MLCMCLLKVNNISEDHIFYCKDICLFGRSSYDGVEKYLERVVTFARACFHEFVKTCFNSLNFGDVEKLATVIHWWFTINHLV